MNNLKRYIQKRKQKDKSFALNFDKGYQDFKIGAILRQAREEAGLTQEQLAKKVKTN